MVDLLSALVAAFDVNPATVDRRPVIDLTEQERSAAETHWGPSRDVRRVLVNISAGTGERTWPTASYIAVIEHVHAREPNAIVRIIAAPSDAERARTIAGATGASHVATPSIRDAFALIAAADLIVTPDTSITHAASAFCVPTVALFVRGKAERWGLVETPGANIEHHEATLATLPVADVLPALDQLLDRPVERRPIGNAALRETR
jgi:ADP-heptose:LPS heptosyltransferase